MRKRKWVLTLAVSCAVLVIGVYTGWRVTRVNDVIKSFLLEKIRPFLAQESDIEKVGMGLGGLHLKGVLLAPKDHSFALRIEDVRVGFTIWNLIRYRFVPYKIAHDVVLVRPELIIRRPGSRTNHLIPEGDWIDFRKWVKALESVRRITVADAGVFVEDAAGDSVRLAHAMNGWLLANPADSAFIRLSGKLFSSPNENLSIEGRLDLIAAKPLRLRMQIDESDPISELPLLLPDYLEVSAVRLQGEATFEEDKPAEGLLQLDGSFSFKNAGLEFADVSVDGTLDGADVLLDGTVGSFNGSSLKIRGQIANLFDPDIDLTLTCSRFDIPAFFREAVPETRMPFEGRAGLHLHFSGPLQNARMNGTFESGDFSAYGFRFERFVTMITVRDSVLILEGDGTQADLLRLDFGGSMDFSTPRNPTEFVIDAKGDFLNAIRPELRQRMRSGRGEVGIRLNGDLENLEGEAMGTVTLISMDLDTLLLMPRLDYRDRHCSINIQSNSGFQLLGMVDHPFHEGTRWDVKAGGMNALLRPLLTGTLRRRIGDLRVDGSFSGTQEDWTLESSGFWQTGKMSDVFRIRLLSEAAGEDQALLSLDGAVYDVEGDSLVLDAAARLGSRVFDIEHFEIGDLAALEGQCPLDSAGNLDVRFHFSNLTLDKLHSFFPKIQPHEGIFQGEVLWSGTLAEPTMDLDVTLGEGVFHSVGVFEGGIEGQWKEGKFRLCSVSFSRDGSPVLMGGAQRVQTDSLVGSFWARDVDFGPLIQAFTGRDFFEGIGSAEFRVAGRTRRPLIRGSFEAVDGSLGSVRFKELTAELIDTLHIDNHLMEGTLSVRKGRMERDDGLKVLYWGELPHSTERDADFSFLAEGNVFGFLPELNGFVRRAEGTGEIFVRWAGRPGNWILGSGRMQVENADLELAGFIKRIQNLEIEAEVQPEARFVYIKRLSGNVDGERIHVSNVTAEGKRLEPLAAEALGIQFGHLRVATTDKGIRVHLPGLMETREKGWIAFEGKEGDEAFTIAGPVENPVLRGTLLLTDLRLTYPFLTITKDSSTARLIEFLETINWDVRVIPMKDVHYVRTVVSPFGNVYTDLLLKDQAGAFYLDGVIEDESLETWGTLESIEGSIDVVNHYFRPERITFDYPRGAKDPILAGRAYTTLIDSMGMPSTVWMTIGSMNDDIGMEQGGGPWSNVQFRFSTDNPNLARTEADLLAAMGYSAQSIRDRAYDALGMQVENVVFRPIFRPLERGLRNYLGLDVVRFYSMFSRNIVQLQSRSDEGFDPRHLLRSTKLTLGKYLAPGFFLTYSGQIQSGLGVHYLRHGMGFRHALSLEYTIRPDLFVQMEYTYDSYLLSDRREDKRIWLRHIFPF